jgi:PST family polysaccharide transporter
MVMGILLAIGGYEYWALVFREIIRNILIVSGFWICCPWLPGLPSRNAGIRELLRFGRDLSATHLLIGMISRLDGLLVGKYFGAIPLGMFRQAYNLMMVPIDQLNVPILSVAQPGLSRLQSEPERYRRYYQKILFFITAATIPIGIITAVFSREITLLLLGEKWIDSSIFLRIFAIGAAIRPAIGTSAIVLITCGKSTRYFILAVAHSVALLIFMLAGIKWGAVGVACAHVGTTVVLIVPKLYYSFLGTQISFRVFFQTIRSPIIAGICLVSFLMACINFKLLTEIGLSYLIFSGIGLIIYIAILFLLADTREYIISLYRDVAISLWEKKPLNVKASPSSI